MNILTKEMRRSLKELDLGLKGELTITPDMEDLGDSLFFDQVPPAWTKRAYASMNGLSNWYNDLIMRIKELEGWTSDFNLTNDNIFIDDIDSETLKMIENIILKS